MRDSTAIELLFCGFPPPPPFAVGSARGAEPFLFILHRAKPQMGPKMKDATCSNHRYQCFRVR